MNSKAENTRTITISYVNQNETLRMILKTAQVFSTKVNQLKCVPKSLCESIGVLCDQLVRPSDEKESGEVYSLEATEKNQKEIQKLFNRIKDLLKKQENEVMEQIKDLSEREQKNLTIFWIHFGETFTKIVDDISEVFEDVLCKISLGYNLDSSVLEEIFNRLKDAFETLIQKKIFDLGDCNYADK